MPDITNTDLAVVGGGAAGLSVAAGAAQLGVDVVLIERAKMGGDCLNTGCIPSKSLLAAAKAAHAARAGSKLGINGHAPSIDFGRVRAHVRDVIAGIAPHDSVERFTGLGVRVVQAEARFTGPREITAGSATIRSRRIVIATGSRPAVPPIPGLADVPFLTNESVFDLLDLPDHLIVIGGGPVGVELAQAYRRLGAEATVLEKFGILPRDEPDAVDSVRRSLVEDGVEIHERAEVRSVEREGNLVAVRFAAAGSDAERRVLGTHLLVATGRQPNIAGLDLEKTGVAWTAAGITVDRRLRTTNHRIYAIGDVTSGPQFTHLATHHASVVVKNALFRFPASVEGRAIPWVTYTDPELAQVGLTRAMARARGIAVRETSWPFADNDRARTDAETEGFVRVLVDRSGRPVGATVVGAHAGEVIQTWVLAISERIKLSRVAQMVAPYPTLGESNKRAAGAYFASSLFSDRTRWIVRLLQRFG